MKLRTKRWHDCCPKVNLSVKFNTCCRWRNHITSNKRRKKRFELKLKKRRKWRSTWRIPWRTTRKSLSIHMPMQLKRELATRKKSKGMRHLPSRNKSRWQPSWLLLRQIVPSFQINSLPHRNLAQIKVQVCRKAIKMMSNWRQLLRQNKRQRTTRWKQAAAMDQWMTKIWM